MSKTKKKAADEKKTKEEKFTLVELVQSSDVHYPSLIMDLHRAGLLEQYKQELEIYGYETITPSITADELDKIIKNFLGE